MRYWCGPWTTWKQVRIQERRKCQAQGGSPRVPARPPPVASRSLRPLHSRAPRPHPLSWVRPARPYSATPRAAYPALPAASEMHATCHTCETTTNHTGVRHRPVPRCSVRALRRMSRSQPALHPLRDACTHAPSEAHGRSESRVRPVTGACTAARLRLPLSLWSPLAAPPSTPPSLRGLGGGRAGGCVR